MKLETREMTVSTGLIDTVIERPLIYVTRQLVLTLGDLSLPCYKLMFKFKLNFLLLATIFGL